MKDAYKFLVFFTAIFLSFDSPF